MMNAMGKNVRGMELTTEEARLVAQFVADYNGGEAQDYLRGDELDSGGDTTRDEFGCYDGRGWHEWSGQTYEEVGGHQAVHYDSVQVAKGHPRYALWVVDFGDFRAIYQM